MKIKNFDKLSSSFWFFLSILICIESYRLGIGEYNNPGAGFFPFWTGVIFGVLSILFFIQNFRTNQKSERDGVFERIKWRNIITVLFSIFVYTLVLEKFGFLLSTFFLIAILIMAVERKKWYIVIIVAVTTAMASYAFFQLWLKTSLPKGIFGI